MSYEEKYLKYKIKYLELKGGNNSKCKKITKLTRSLSAPMLKTNNADLKLTPGIKPASAPATPVPADLSKPVLSAKPKLSEGLENNEAAATKIANFARLILATRKLDKLKIEITKLEKREIEINKLQKPVESVEINEELSIIICQLEELEKELHVLLEYIDNLKRNL